MAEPTDNELRAVIRNIVAKVDLEMTGISKFTKLLSKEFGGIHPATSPSLSRKPD
jgi:hypothetical protein